MLHDEDCEQVPNVPTQVPIWPQHNLSAHPHLA
jgi:hypothetical protein